MGRFDAQPATVSPRYSVGDRVRVRVNEIDNPQRVIANYVATVQSVERGICTTDDGSQWDALTGAAIGWLSRGQRARIMLERYAETKPGPRKAVRL